MSKNIERRPRITIGITCYNAQDTITRAVESALNQDWANIEFVIVDDCSTDGSWGSLVNLSKSDSRILIVRHEVNTGVAGARQTILDHATGEFLAYFDDDDDNVPDRLTAQFERITNYEKATGADLVFCYSDRAVVKVGQTMPDHVGRGIGYVSPEPHGPMVANFILGINALPSYSWGMHGSCTIMARREAYLRVGGFDADFRRCGELDLAIRGAQMGAHFISVDRSLVTQYKTQSADKSGTKPLFYTLKLREKHRDYLDTEGLYEASRMFARSNFWGSKKKRFKSRFYRTLGYALAPQLIPSYIKRRFGGGA